MNEEEDEFYVGANVKLVGQLYETSYGTKDAKNYKPKFNKGGIYNILKIVQNPRKNQVAIYCIGKDHIPEGWASKEDLEFAF